MVSTGALAVLVSYVAMVASNALSNMKVFGGKDNKEISDSHPTYLTPDGFTFAVWGMIYLMLTVMVIYQLMPSDHAEALLQQGCPLTGMDVRWRLVAAFMCNSVWLPVFNNERFGEALVIMAAYLSFLISIYLDINVAKTSGVFEGFLLSSGVAMNLSWIIVAFSLSIFFCLGEVGWKTQHGVAGSTGSAAVVCFLVAALGCERAVRAGDVAYAFVAGWALMGIYRMQTVADMVRFPIKGLNASYGKSAQMLAYVAWAAAVFAALRPLLSKSR
eukprot:TRINITY_DN23032_c0_g1_i3.p1 TRINITY_DN23032_c0_g1~~TRINITY_DN23032_c0_g1_i3.p1  ORF type:complete len:273 (+),score=51.80 TRINITY_DN23032_c0_g1_i3:77-895(+)